MAASKDEHPSAIGLFRPGSVLELAEDHRHSAYGRIDDGRRADLGQFGTPAAVAKVLADMFREIPREVRLLDAGAGVGSLAAAFVSRALQSPQGPGSIHVTAVEFEQDLIRPLEATLSRCHHDCRAVHVDFTFEIVHGDYIEWAAEALGAGMFAKPNAVSFNCAIQNPPYRKIRSDSRHRKLLSSLGIEATNLYAAFVALTLKWLEPGGRLVAITPRSFCNGTYFQPFRRLMLDEAAIERIHTFDRRDKAFGGDGVLQETIAFALCRGVTAPGGVMVTSSSGDAGGPVSEYMLDYSKVVPPGQERVIHIPDGVSCAGAAASPAGLPNSCTTLHGLGLAVSTGRVVEFRMRGLLREQPGENTAPLLYPRHFRAGVVLWPVADGRGRPNAIVLDEASTKTLFPSGCYVLLRRFSAKEERRRLYAALLLPASLGSQPFAAENHVNVIHCDGGGLPEALARGLVAYLNSTQADQQFRQFSGHTQVNAGDLRNMPYPNREALERLGGCMAGNVLPSQEELDRAVEEVAR